MSTGKILVTGASGFLGGRLVERLLWGEKVPVRALAHSPGGAARLSRLPVEIAWGDLTDPASVEKAMEGCDVVVHCAYGSRGDNAENRRSTVDGTRVLAETAAAQGVKRFVHISSVAVYTYLPPPNVNEETPLATGGDAYSRDKANAERAVWAVAQQGKLPLSVLRMGNIYGPFSGAWTSRPLAHIQQGLVSLVDGGLHSSNMVFVDNAVEAILLAIREPAAVGQAFFITDNPISWADFYGQYAAWLGNAPLHSISTQDMLDHFEIPFGKKVSLFGKEVGSHLILPTFRFAARRIESSTYMRELVFATWRRLPRSTRLNVLGDPNLSAAAKPAPRVEPVESGPKLPPYGLLQVYAGKANFSNAKAKRLLGYGPLVSTQEGLEITRQWAQWARLTP